MEQTLVTFAASLVVLMLPYRAMPSCGKQLQALKELNLKSGPAHLQSKPQGMAPTPLIPISISTGVDFVS
jgi:hypothetical protein